MESVNISRGIFVGLDYVVGTQSKCVVLCEAVEWPSASIGPPLRSES